MIYDYLNKLVGYATVEGNEDVFTDCLDWLEQFFSDRFLYTHRSVFNGSPSLVATTKATKSPKVLLQAHLDVVPAPKSLFKINENGDKLTGRGVFDMKFAIATFMSLLDELSEDITKYDFGIMITTDEESGGQNGVKHLLEEGWSTDLCILPDGGDNWRLEEVAKGFWLIEATSDGKTAHGSRPWEGVNAIDNLINFLQEIKPIFKDQNTTTPTLTVAQINGGEALNQVPEHATAMLDIRTTERNNHHDIVKTLESAATKHDVTLEMKFSGEPLLTDIKTAYAQSFLKSVEEVTKQPAELTQSLGSSDGRYFADHNIQVLIMRPNGGGAHSDNEWVQKSDLPKYQSLLNQFLNKHAQ